jgi:hypothetical protein
VVTVASVALLALASSVVGISNEFTYDDRYIIPMNPAMHGAMRWWRAFVTSYWPPDWGGDGYRPLTILAFRLQTIVGHDKPMVFHAVNIALYAAIAVSVYFLARQLLPRWAAWLSAALFAVHPVHVEAVANVVGQSELLVAVAFIPAVMLYVRARRRGALTLGTGAVVALLYVIACLSKEHGVVLPAVLVAAELTVLGGADLRADVLQRLRDPRLRTFYLSLAALGLAFIGVRGAVLADHGLGGFQPFTPFSSLQIGTRDRVLTAIGLVPEWIRLFYWPLHLSSDYSPPGTEIAQGFEVSQLPGALLLIAVLAFGVLLARRKPVISFGIAFVVITLLPSSNFLVPAGILLAERTLLLPSVGAMVIVGGLAATIAERVRERGRWILPARVAACAAAAVVLVAGGMRSSQRTRIWHDNDTLFHQTVIDSPLSYRAHYMLGAWSFELKRQRVGEEEYQTALKLFPYDPYLAFTLAEQYRDKKLCGPAVPLYKWALGMNSSMGRTQLASCLLETGDYPGAKQYAFQAMAAGGDIKLLRRIVFLADSAGSAPSHSPRAEPMASQAGRPGKKHEASQNTVGASAARDAEPARKSL